MLEKIVKFFLNDVESDDIEPKVDTAVPTSRGQRQTGLMQKVKTRVQAWLPKSKSLDEPTAVADQAEDVHERLKRYAGGDQQALTRAENRLTGKGRYELDPSTRKLTPLGKQMRLRRRLNITMGLLILMIIITWLILFFI